MRTPGSRRAWLSRPATVGLLAALLAGCGGDLRPVRVGVTKIDLIGPQLLPRWHALQVDLALKLNRPVQFEVLSPRQIRTHLADGRLTLALLDAVEYAQIAPAGHHVLLATAVNSAGRTERVGLIITKSGSDVTAIDQLKGCRFDFGPKGDPLLDAAGVIALHRAGIGLDELEKSPLLGGRYRHISSGEVAKAVAYERPVAAGIIDEADYERWPEKGGVPVLGTLSRDRVRILGRTVAVPELTVVASRQADPKMIETLRRYFTVELNRKSIGVLSWMGVRGFRPADPDGYGPFVAAVNELFPLDRKPEPEERDSTDTRPGL